MTTRSGKPPRWSVAPDARHLLRDGEDDFLLADTLWALPHRATPDEVRQVVERRVAQGFNAALISLLPISNDHSGTVEPPFLTVDGGPDLGAVDPAWLERADALIGEVADGGLTPILILQWTSWVPRSWAASPRPDLVMTDAESVAWADAVIPVLRHHRPIWSLTGDDKFITRESLRRAALLADRVRELDPEALVTAHSSGLISMPPEVQQLTDFVGYQSGHDSATWAIAPQQWNEHLAAVGVEQPAMNLEPAYEGHGYGQGTGRFTARDVRTASWRSVITGAGAGLGYGAHGLWSWHHDGDPFTSEDWSGIPFEAMTALDFAGADDVGWLRRVAIEQRLWELEGRRDLLVGANPSGMSVGATPGLGRVVVHSPHAFRLELTLPEPGSYTVRSWSLTRRAEVAVAASADGDGRLAIATPPELTDLIHVLAKEQSP